MRIATLFRGDRERIAASPEGSSSMLRLHEGLQANPFLTAAQAASKTGLSVPTVNSALAGLEALGIVCEITGKQRGRVFAYDAFLQILDEGTSSAGKHGNA
ncbi:winged helix-turn-helix transcriptional regulator [Aromatoleum aromaticum]|nr:winged helix-turn-helix transcriptional regulator [Aromatoleum aromaticum]